MVRTLSAVANLVAVLYVGTEPAILATIVALMVSYSSSTLDNSNSYTVFPKINAGSKINAGLK